MPLLSLSFHIREMKGLHQVMVTTPCPLKKYSPLGKLKQSKVNIKPMSGWMVKEPCGGWPEGKGAYWKGGHPSFGARF